MNKPSVDLLQSLENKLKSANIRSPYLRATVGRSRNRVDAKAIDLLTEEGENRLTTALLNDLQNAEKGGAFKTSLKIVSANAAKKTEEERFQMDTLITRLKNIHFDQEEDFLEHGTRSFGFGYPLISLRSKQDKNRVLLAPLFIWSLSIEPEPNNHNAYVVSRSNDHPIILNPQFVAFLENDYGYTLEKIPEEYFDNDCLTKEEVATLVEKIADLLNATVVSDENGMESIKDLDYYSRMMDNQPIIYPSGIFTLFKSNKESIVDDYHKMIQGLDDMMFDDPNIYQPYQEDYFSSVPLDPSQEGILRNITDHKKVIIQGPPGTGKSNSLTGIILNALENSAKTLVVCEKKTALEVIASNLTEKGLDEFCAVIDNVNSDRQKLVRALRERFDERKYKEASTISLSEYHNSKSQFQLVYTELQEKYGNLLVRVLGDMSWKDCIGNYLQAKRKSESSELLSVGTMPNEMTEETFFKGLNAVKEGAFLRENCSESRAVFDVLKASLFTEPSLTTSNMRSLESSLKEKYEKATPVITQAQKFTQENTQEDIEGWLKPSALKKLVALFSGSLKRSISEAKELKEGLAVIEKSFDTVFSGQNNSNHFHEKVEALINRYKQLEQLLTSYSDFRNYYAWRYFYDNGTLNFHKELFDALEGISTNQWESEYRKWFLNLILEEKEVELGDFPTDERSLSRIKEMDDKIDHQQDSSIRTIWYAHQQKAMKDRTLQSMRLLFNLRANSTFRKRNSLRQLMHDEFDLITAFFPVILVNPSVCSSIFPLKPGLFDLVIFDEASQLRLEDTFPALLRGRFQVISGDIHQMPPSTHFRGAASDAANKSLEDLEDDVVFSEEESLLTYAQNSDFEFNYLDFHYRSQHPHLIDFSNAAFYGKRLVPMPPSYKGKPIILREVGGIYEDNKNEGEAHEIIRLLFEEIQPNEKGEYPSIGVATFNMTQQRYLWERIWSLADKDDAIREKLARLESAGFFIKNLENIQGDQRDIVIISTTFGVRPDGRFIQNFGPINQDKGYKLLNVIVTRAKQQMYIVTSIPSEFYSNYRSDIMTKGNTGKGIFYAYLNYAKFCSEGNESARVELLQFLLQDKQEETAQPSQDPDNFLTESVFEEEVLEELLQFVSANRIETQFQLGGFRLDMVVKNSDGSPNVVIECDGKTYHSSKVAYRYDLHRQSILERHGLKVYRIWSTNWWREKDREVLKLKRYLEEHGLVG